MIDLLFPLIGDCVFPGYQYPLYAAIKGVDLATAQHPDIYFGPIEGLTPVQGLLLIGPTTRWRVRVPSADVGRDVANCLCGVSLRVGSHLITPRQPLLVGVRVTPHMHAEMVCVRSMHFRQGRGQPTHPEFCAWFGDNLRRRIGLGPDATFCVGRRRRISVGPNRTPTIGYAVEVKGLKPDHGWALMAMGGRRHMGASMWLPGGLPGHWKTEGSRWMRPGPDTCRTECVSTTEEGSYD